MDGCLNAGGALPAALLEPRGATTWTAGRNALARHVYATEVQRGRAYSHWAFSDADMTGMNCRLCPRQPKRGAPPDAAASALAAACCLDFLVALSVGAGGTAGGAAVASGAIAGGYRLAVVYARLSEREALDLAREDEAEIDRFFIFKDCGDANLNVFDREAAPVLLPWLEDFDKESWWISQVALWRFATGCLAGACALPGRSLNLPDGADEHASYPKAPPLGGRESARIAHDWPALVAEGGPLTAARSAGFPACARGQRGLATFPLGTGDAPLPDWPRSSAFLECRRERAPSFVRNIGGGVPEAPPWPRRGGAVARCA